MAQSKMGDQMEETNPLDRLRALGIELPEPPKPFASYIPVRVVPLAEGRSLIFVSGQIATRDGVPVGKGSVPDEVSVEEAQEIARLCAVNVLAQVHAAAGLENVEQVVALTVYVRSADDFEQQPQVGNAASDLIAEVLGEAGHHTRAAVGVNALPLGVPVEIAAVVQVRSPQV